MNDGNCCTNHCANGVCNLATCTSDGQGCTTDGQCCGGKCENGTCTALNGLCKTLGNACTDLNDCCSKLCTNGVCSAASYCAQNGDICVDNTQCCGGICSKANGGFYGTCSQPPTGSANCSLTDGMLCAGGAVFDGTDIPSCGGACCSRLCAPYGPTGVLVCQPASGCHVVGDLCTKDTDCCGAAGLPGGSGQPVTCDKAGLPVGVCRNPMGCKPDGDVCRLDTISCNASCDCCSGNCQNEDSCHLDNVGIPRCSGIQCVDAGGSCASSANCCNGLPCVPNPSGNPPYVCGATSCVDQCGACTVNADCCAGFTCERPVGSTAGVCGPCGGTTTTTTTTTSTGATGSTSSTTGSGGCSLYGQDCMTDTDCCNNVPCNNQFGNPCPAGDTTCTCHVVPQ